MIDQLLARYKEQSQAKPDAKMFADMVKQRFMAQKDKNQAYQAAVAQQNQPWKV